MGGPIVTYRRSRSTDTRPSLRSMTLAEAVRAMHEQRIDRLDVEAELDRRRQAGIPLDADRTGE